MKIKACRAIPTLITSLLPIVVRPLIAAASELPPDVKSFATRKEAQTQELAERFHVDVSPDIWRYFAAAKKGDFATVERLFEKLKKREGQYEGSRSDPTVTSEIWQPVLETELHRVSESLFEVINRAILTAEAFFVGRFSKSA